MDNKVTSREAECRQAGLTIVSGEELLLPYMPTEEELTREAEKVELGDTIHYVEEQVLTTAAMYYLLPSIKYAIPQCTGACDILVECLIEFSDFAGSQELSDYPMVTEYHLRKHFPEYHILPRRCLVKVSKPIWLSSLRERDRAKKLAALCNIRRIATKTSKQIVDIEIL